MRAYAYGVCYYLSCQYELDELSGEVEFDSYTVWESLVCANNPIVTSWEDHLRRFLFTGGYTINRRLMVKNLIESLEEVLE